MSLNENSLVKRAELRKQLESKAQSFVEFMIFNDTIGIEKLNFFCRYLNQSQYEDVVEERFLSKICGYPLCEQKLLNIPKNKYKISLIDSKVYDLTSRKRFCCNFCFLSSNHLKSQICSSPIWLRNFEETINFDFLTKNVLNQNYEKNKKEKNQIFGTKFNYLRGQGIICLEKEDCSLIEQLKLLKLEEQLLQKHGEINLKQANAIRGSNHKKKSSKNSGRPTNSIKVDKVHTIFPLQIENLFKEWKTPTTYLFLKKYFDFPFQNETLKNVVGFEEENKILSQENLTKINRILPNIDSRDASLIRNKIFLEKLNPVMVYLGNVLDLSHSLLMNYSKQIISFLRLTSRNILFNSLTLKTVAWIFILAFARIDKSIEEKLFKIYFHFGQPLYSLDNNLTSHQIQFIYFLQQLKDMDFDDSFFKKLLDCFFKKELDY